jgi:hypothetical protein
MEKNLPQRKIFVFSGKYLSIADKYFSNMDHIFFMGKLFIQERIHFSSLENYLSRRNNIYPRKENIFQER